jgi:hypothetical protein
MAKLPKDFLRAAGAETLLDSPFRRTERADTPLDPAPQPPAPAAAPSVQAAPPPAPTRPTNETAPLQWHRFTVRIPEPLRERLEDEAYRRSRATKRTIGLADLVRELLEERDREQLAKAGQGG